MTALMSDFKAPKPPPMSEAQLQAAVIDLAHAFNFMVAHFRPAQTGRGWRTPVSADGRGFPDLVLAKPGRILFVELKGPKGELTGQQLTWQAALNGHVWRPADWDSGEILRTLSTPAAVRPLDPEMPR